MKIVILGATGMLGHKVTEVLRNKYGQKIVALAAKNSDKINSVENSFPFNALVNKISLPERFDYVINCIGIIKPFVEKSGHLKVMEVNSIFPYKLAKYCEEQNSKLIHITTDCVFSGKKGHYTEEDIHDAKDIYGRSKSMGEPKNCMVLRTSIIGEEKYNNVSLVEWAKSQKGKIVKGFTNHFWNGVTTKKYGEICIDIIENDLYEKGIFHIFSSNDITKKELLFILDRKFNLDLTVEEEEADTPIDRTLRTIKNLNSKLSIPSIQEQIQEM